MICLLWCQELAISLQHEGQQVLLVYLRAFLLWLVLFSSISLDGLSGRRLYFLCLISSTNCLISLLKLVYIAVALAIPLAATFRQAFLLLQFQSDYCHPPLFSNLVCWQWLLFMGYLDSIVKHGNTKTISFSPSFNGWGSGGNFYMIQLFAHCCVMWHLAL